MSSEFQNYVPIQGIRVVSGINQATENISESSQLIDPESVTESISESAVVIIT